MKGFFSNTSILTNYRNNRLIFTTEEIDYLSHSMLINRKEFHGALILLAFVLLQYDDTLKYFVVMRYVSFTYHN